MFAVLPQWDWRGGASSLAVAASVLVAVASPVCANAGTAAERRLLAMPPPHEGGGSGQKIRAHWVRQIMFRGDVKSREGAAELKREYERCVRTARPGAIIKPVQEWPERSAFSIKDFYLSADMFVEYEYLVSYAVGMTFGMGCELVEATQFEARGKLLSEKGLCSFDLSAKTASGECRAQLPKMAASSQRKARIARADKPAAPGAVLGLYTVTDEIKRFNGVPCRVVKAKLGAGMMSHCFAQMGSFRGFHAGAPRPDDAVALSLEDIFEDASGIHSEGRALKAVPDLFVSADVFFPFLNGRFNISEASESPGGASDDGDLDEVGE